MQARPSAHARPAPLPPASLRETAVATRGALRLSWTADRRGTLVVVAVSAVSMWGQIAKLGASQRALDAVLGRQPARQQARRLLVVGGTGLVGLIGGNLSFQVQNPLNQATGRLAEGLVLDALAGLELAEVEDAEFQDRLHRVLAASTQQGQLLGHFVAAGVRRRRCVRRVGQDGC